jgi:hypothetical protein
VKNILLDLDGIATVGELLSITPLEGGRSALEVHSRRMLPLGRSCQVLDATGRTIDCVVAHASKTGEFYVLDLRTVDDASFLAKGAKGSSNGGSPR